MFLANLPEVATQTCLFNIPLTLAARWFVWGFCITAGATAMTIGTRQLNRVDDLSLVKRRVGDFRHPGSFELRASGASATGPRAHKKASCCLIQTTGERYHGGFGLAPIQLGSTKYGNECRARRSILSRRGASGAVVGRKKAACIWFSECPLRFLHSQWARARSQRI